MKLFILSKLYHLSYKLHKQNPMEDTRDISNKQEETAPEKVESKPETEVVQGQKTERREVVVQPMPEQEKNKVELSTLGEQPFEIDESEDEVNYVSCRIGSIMKQGMKSVNLKSLFLRNNLIQVIQGLDGFPNLTELQLYDNKIMKIEGLQALLSLQVLDLSYNNIKTIENISHLKKLKKLYLLSNKIKKIENLELPELDMLELGSNKIKEIQNLDGVSNVRSLYLGKNRISEIKNLGHLGKLQQVALGPNRLTEINQGLLPLKDSLKEVYLQENKITLIRNVNDLLKLQILDISYNAVEHLDSIDKLAKLECLYLNGNKISEYQQLGNLKHNSKLTTISLFGNDVTKEPGYRMRLVQLLPDIDDIDGTPMKTSYKIVFGSGKEIKEKEEK